MSSPLARLSGSVLAVAALAAAGVAALAVGPAVPHDAVVAAVPARATLQVLDGAVLTVAQVGRTVLLGGSFTKVRSPGGAVVSQPRVAAFDAVTGELRSGFAPQLDGAVQALAAGPREGTVYVGGDFNTLGGVKRKGLVLLDLATGAPADGFAFPASNGTVQTVELVGDRLFVGGTFTKLGAKLRGGLASLAADSGRLDDYLTSSVTENHNWTTSSPVGNAKAAVGVTRLDVTPDGTKMVAIGNFRKVDGLVKDQIAMWDLGASAATVRNWRTLRYEPACLEKKYDSYVRDLEVAPDGTYFVVATTGGHRVGALCDTAARWETSTTGQAVEPTWANYSGADSLLSTAVTGEAVYVGGHQRWLNNGLGRDDAGQGAVPRPGVGALDPVTGVPLAWNPGRHPRGVGATALHATPDGLWMGSDTSYVGVGPDTTSDPENPQCRPERAEQTCYARPRIAFFPLVGGAPSRSTAERRLPGGVHVAKAPAPSATGVLARVNAGGPRLRTVDAGRDWDRDENTSPLHPARLNGGNISAYGIPVRSVDATVPSGTPHAVFAQERRDPGVKGDGKGMRFTFGGLKPGEAVEARVYVANRCVCTAPPPRRVFDVLVNGVTALDDFEPTLLPLHTGTMRSLPATVSSSGTITVGFGHEVGDPVVSAVEVVRAAAPGPYPLGAATATVRAYDGTTAGQATAVDLPADVASARAAVQIGDQLFYGAVDGGFYRRPVAGSVLGERRLVDPYADPVWADVSTGSGNTYRGAKPAFYNDITNLTSLAWDAATHRLLYTVYGSTAVSSRAFSPDSGVLHHDRSVLVPTLPTTVTGAFVSGGRLHYGAADGTLRAVPLDGSGPAVVLSGPGVDGVDWSGSALWLGARPGENAAPTAAFTAACTYAECAFDGSGSRDADGDVVDWRWDLGDGSTASGATPTHAYAADGTYDVVLTVTDSGGATSTATRTLQVAGRPVSPVQFVDRTARLTVSTTQTQLAVPPATAPGDRLVLTTTTNGPPAMTPGPGWTEVGRWANGTATTTGLWTRTATEADLGTAVLLTSPSSVKASVALLAYRSVGEVTAAFAGDAASGSTAHTTPAAAVPVSGSWVVSAWTDKTSTDGHGLFGVPDGLAERVHLPGSGGSYLSTLIADEGSGVLAGTTPSRTATTSIGTRAAMLTVVLAPAG